MEIARDKGKATGNVSTAEITDATPAAPSSHISQRACQGPADARTTCPTEAKTAATPGLGSIAEQQVDEGFDVYLGGGRARYEQTLDRRRHRRRRRLRRDQRLPVRRHEAGLDGDRRARTAAKLLGLFNPSNMTTEYAPLFARTNAYYDANPAVTYRSRAAARRRAASRRTAATSRRCRR